MFRKHLSLPVLALALATLFTVVSPSRVHVQTASGNRLLLTLQQRDASGRPIINRQIGPIVYNGTVGTFYTGTMTTTEQQITLPAAVILQLYIKNTSPTITLQVDWAYPSDPPQIPHVVQVLRPGAVLVFWQPSTATSVGIDQLTFHGILDGIGVVGAKYEMFLGG